MVRNFALKLSFLLFLLITGYCCIGQEFVATPNNFSVTSTTGGKCANVTYTFSNIKINISNSTYARITGLSSFPSTQCPNGVCSVAINESTSDIIITSRQIIITFPSKELSYCTADNVKAYGTFRFVSDLYIANPLSFYQVTGGLDLDLSGLQTGNGSVETTFDFQSWDIFFALKGPKNGVPQANGNFIVCSSDNIQADVTIHSPIGRTYNINIERGGVLLRTIGTITTSATEFSGAYFSSSFKLTDITNDLSGLQLRVVEIVNGREVRDRAGSRNIDVSKAAVTPLISSSKSLLCSTSESSELVVTNAEPNILYSWSNGATGSKISASGTGVYYVNAQPTSTGAEPVCPAVKSESVEISALVFDPIIIQPDSKVKCEGEHIQLEADPKGNGEFSYIWSKDGASAGEGQIIQATQSGVYKVVVQPGGTGCKAKEASNTITLQFSEPIVGATISTPDGKTAICGAPEQPSLELTAMPANLTYSWTRDGTDLGTNTQKLTIMQGGKYEVLLTKGGCTTTETIEIADNNFDPAIADSPLIYCTDSPLTLSAKADNAELYDYSWKQGTNSIGTNSPSLTLPAQAGTFKYTVEIVAKNSGCKEKTSQEVTIKSDQAIANPTITPNPAVICDTTAGLTLSAVADSSAGISYLWTGSGNAGSDPSKFVVYNAGTYSVTFQRGACKATQTVSPRVNTLEVILTKTGTSDPILLCSGENNVPVELRAESNLSTATIKWYREKESEAPGNNTGNRYFPTETGTYYATAQFGTCIAKSPQTVRTELLSSFSATIFPESITPFCEDKSIELEARPSQANLSSRLGYTWSQDGKVVKSEPGKAGSLLMTGKNVKYTGNTLADQIEADFTVTVALDGCKATSPVKTVSMKPSRTSIIVLDRNTLEATESIDGAYQWFYRQDFATSPEDTVNNYQAVPGATSRILMGADKGSYLVRANRNGCGVKKSLAYTVDAITSVDPTGEKEWKVYPNPAFEAVIVEQVMHNAIPATIEMRNTAGQLLRRDRQLKSIENYPLDDLPPGVYFLEISQGNRVINKKFVKQ